MDLNIVIQSLSLPIIKDLLTIVVNKLDKYELYKDSLDSLIKDNDSVIGTFKIDYIKDGTNCEAYVLFKICDVNHDLTVEFNKVKNYISAEQWQHVLKHISTMIYVLRIMYKKVINDMDLGDLYSELLVDILTTTMYLPGITERIGIFIENN